MCQPLYPCFGITFQPTVSTVYHLTLHAIASEYHMKIDDQIIISSDLTIKKVSMIITMLYDLHNYSYIDLAMHSRPLGSILATEMIILCAHSDL